jgi:hypothetical protein
MGAISMTLGGHVFPTKISVKRFVQSILRRDEGEIDPSSFAFAVMRDLLNYHPSAARKIGPGVCAIFVCVMPEHYYSKGFVLKRVDGTQTDFSYRECLNPSKPRDWFAQGCRTAIKRQVDALRDHVLGAGDVYCPITGELLVGGNCHIDHAPPWTFAKIFEAFVDEFSIDFAMVDYADRHLDYSTESRLNDELAEKFSKFHDERARLRAVSVRANTVILRAGRPPGPRKIAWSKALARWVDVDDAVKPT